ncbi:uncharacterized protein AKAME5_000000700 [Lates japonicus]|uniref:Uncharacterized protein n=1 Tax=Lates japonicus TaxID=270547 RepID=A0AAD3QVR5_LATJO|nr:uncharacterized protein AKAME5_000000700 [Lates japonicus]
METRTRLMARMPSSIDFTLPPLSCLWCFLPTPPDQYFPLNTNSNHQLSLLTLPSYCSKPSFQPNPNPPHSGISPRLLRACSSQLCNILTHLFNLSLKLQKTPELWKT